MPDVPVTPAPGMALPDDLVPLPITAVTCMEDRAHIEREGTVRVAAGVTRLRVGPVTPLTVDRTLRAELTGGARVVDSRVVRRYTPPPPGGPGQDASALLRDVHELQRELAEVQLLEQRQKSALAVVEQARDDVHRDIVQGAGAGDADPERWADRLDRVEGAAEPRIAELHKLRRRLHDVGDELLEAQQALAAIEGTPMVMSAYLELVVEAGEDGEAGLRVGSLVPCALWRPAYCATLAADRSSVRMETDAFVWQETGEDWTGVRLTLSTARPTLAASPPRLADDVLELRDRTAEERRVVTVDLREEEIRTVSAPAGMPHVPGVDDGGTVRTLRAPHPVSVPSDRRPHRVHLTAFDAPCTVEDRCVPELSPLVVPVARLTNSAGHVLLAGPVDLVRGSGFTGRVRLDFTGTDEEFEVPFGSEDTFRVVRHTEESRETAGLTGINHRTVLTRRVRLFVSRLDSSPAGGEREVVLRERIPVSEVSAVEVKIRSAECDPPPAGVDGEGVVLFRLRLPPGAHREVAFAYDVTAPSSVQGL